MKTKLSADLLNKYLKDECSAEEEAFIDEWYASFEQDNDYISSIPEVERQLLKARIRAGVNGRDDNEVPVIRHPQSRRAFIYALSAVAACFIMAFVLFLNRKTAKPRSAAEMIIVTNNTPNIYNQELSDGSHVWLSPGAEIKFSKVFSGKTREVYMSGESFFEVTKNPSKPFIIYSGNLVTKVWGTSFRVRDSKALPFADVTVVTGKVSVKLVHQGLLKSGGGVHSGKDVEVMIYPAEQATYSKLKEVFKEVPKVNMKELHIWKKINIAFDSKPINEVLPVLSREFDVNLTTSDEKVKAYLLNADFNGLNLPEVLELLHKTLNVSYVMKGNDVILTSN